MSKVTDEQQCQRYSAARMARDYRFDGAFFVAVKSTGIFCRPICPAPLPMEKNVDYYTVASQALDAGFRPCLRCRPDSAPGSPAWQGADTTLSRGLSLLAENHEQSIPDIAARLGISQRYLHKLVSENLGLSPQKYRRYNQALFAKQLLQQTMLPVTDIALASGLNSARRLQSLCQQILDKTPSQLRAQHASETPESISLFLSYRPPYDWEAIREFLKRRLIHNTEVIDEQSFAKVFTYGKGIGRFKATHVAQKHGFSVEVQVSDLTILRPVIANIKRLLDLSADPMIIAESLIKTGLSQTYINPGMRQPGVWNEFEAGVRAILGQQVSVTAAINLLNKVVAEYGERTPYGTAFPLPENIATASLECISMPGARKEALRNFAALYREYDSPQDAQILAIKGIGQWTLDYISLRGRSWPDVYLGGDLIVKKMQSRTPITPQNGAPWRSYLTLQLWALSDRTKE